MPRAGHFSGAIMTQVIELRNAMQYLVKNYTFKMAIAGNNNSPALLKKLENEALTKGLPFYNLKRNKAFISSSKLD